MAEQDPTPLTVCIVCGETIGPDEGVVATAYHEGGELSGSVMHHKTCAWPPPAPADTD